MIAAPARIKDTSKSLRALYEYASSNRAGNAAMSSLVTDIMYRNMQRLGNCTIRRARYHMRVSNRRALSTHGDFEHRCCTDNVQRLAVHCIKLGLADLGHNGFDAQVHAVAHGVGVKILH